LEELGRALELALSGQGDAEILESVAVLGVELDRLERCGYGIVPAVEVEERHAKIVPGQGVRGIELGGKLESRCGAIVAPHVVEELAEAAQIDRIGRRQLDDAPEEIERP